MKEISQLQSYEIIHLFTLFHLLVLSSTSRIMLKIVEKKTPTMRNGKLSHSAAYGFTVSNHAFHEH